ELRRAGERHVVAESAINLVANEQDTLFLRKQGQVAHPLHAVNSAGRVGRAVDDNGLGPRRDGGTHAVGVDVEVGIGVQVKGCPAGQGDQGGVQDEEGVEADARVAGVDDAAQGQHQPAAGAAGDEQFAVGVGQSTADVGGDAGAELGDALGDGVGI